MSKKTLECHYIGGGVMTEVIDTSDDIYTIQSMAKVINYLNERVSTLESEKQKQQEFIKNIKGKISLYLDIAYSSEETSVRIEHLEYILRLMEEYEDETL